MNFDIVFVLLALIGMIAALVWDKMRPGMVLLTVVVFFLCVGILTPKEMLEGFSNKGMITVAMLFLVSEGVRQSGALGQLIKKLLPEGKTTVFKAQARMLPPVAFVSAFLNNTPVVVIFAPIIKRWAEAVRLPATKFLIPLSYVTILGGICTLIGTSTNLVVHGMILEAGYEGFTMFELGKVGIFIAIAGILYLFAFSNKLLPDSRTDTVSEDGEDENPGNFHRVEAVLGARFPGINKTLGEFNFTRHYGAIVKEVKSGGQRFTRNLDTVVLPIGKAQKHLLVETSYFNPPMGLNNILLRIKAKGYIPVLAHPERYTYMNEKDYWRLKGMNVRFQLNLLSLIGAYGPEVRGKEEWLLKNGYYQLCGTDIHSLKLWKESVMKKRISGNVSRMLQGIIATHFPG